MKTKYQLITILFFVCGLMLMTISSQAQVLDLESTTEGALLPRMTTAQRTAITAATLSPAEMVYDTDTKSFWYWEDMQWNELAAGSGPSASGDEIKDADNDTKIQVEESADEDIIRFDIGGSEELRLEKTPGGSLRIVPANNNSIFGSDAGLSLTTGAGNTILGRLAGQDLLTGNANVFLGVQAGSNNTAGSNNVIIGVGAGQNSVLGNNVFIGSFAGFNETGSQKLYIEGDGSGTSNPLIYGEFDNNYLRIGGRLAATGGFTDADNDTKIQVEESTNDNIVRVDIAGTEMLILSKNTGDDLLIAPKNSSFNTIIGNGAGISVTGQECVIIGTDTGHAIGTGSTAVGKSAGRQSTGIQNTFIGLNSGETNTSGATNTFLGSFSGRNSSGSGNVFLGFNVGSSETGSSKLMIDNSSTTTPLIYGEFDTNKVGINTNKTPGTFQVTNPDSDKTSMYLLPRSTGTEDSSSVYFAEDFDADYGMEILYDGVGNELEIYGHSDGTLNGPHLLIKRDNGQVAIGDDFAAGYKLSVDGKVACEEVLVDMNADWPDYVFQPEYNLRTIEEVEKHIVEKGHLPNVPSAEEVENKGIEVGEMNRILMEKVEELTLYIIEQNKQITDLSTRLSKVEKN